ncbi:claudin-10 [Siniperca chuatsi]|uniref:claudin-10 n=1 Tax=Siniperca chuatsi TaxID=119488 RepID=UPI001CE09A22|nr:claudin-10 [Siniperca chuatsi]XP_044044189.1 claudin-10 [Siniperca chuatsi]XP_044044190.1 claudin-10 [Siniperca chuatsi]XP_044044191.1 claudin-10 [Siniperca chuatsi]XP_044044192.1 claudin-10 [Siniperca chuatsi]
MKIRVVQIWGFLMTVLGWIFMACTLAMEGWKITAIGGMGGSAVIKVAWYWSSLWRSCYTDSTAVSNCYDYPVLWSVEGSIQIVRGLLMAALSLGMMGFVLSLMGMECTFIGGKDRSKYKKIYTGGWCHIISGLLSTCGYAVYAQYVSVEYFNPDFDGLKYDLGTPLFLGWVGSIFQMTGGFFYLWSVCTPLCGGEDMVINVQPLPDPKQNMVTTALCKVSSVSELSERSDVSDIFSRSKSGRTAKSGRPLKMGQTTRSAGSRSGSGSESGLSARSSISILSESRSSSTGSSSRTVLSLSGSSRSETTPFIKNSYI